MAEAHDLTGAVDELLGPVEAVTDTALAHLAVEDLLAELLEWGKVY